MTDPVSESTEASPPEQTESVAEKAPVFGSGFSSAGGFAAFSGAPEDAKGEDGAEGEQDAEEECKAEFTPLVQLEEVEKTTGEENEDCLLELKCKMYRFEKESNEWKERGIGMAKFLENKTSKKIRFLMRQEKTLKIRANHIIVPGTSISSHGGNDKAWVWSAQDFADGEQKMELLAIRFGTVEKAKEFKSQYEKAMEHNAPLLAGGAGETTEADPEVEKKVDDLADKVAETKVEEPEVVEKES